MAKIHTLTYNGTKSSDLGVFVSGSGSFDAAEFDVDKYEIPGRNGDLILSNNRYKNIEITYPAFIPKAFMDKVQNVRNWLRSSKVYARLEDTYDMDHYRLGIPTGVQSFSPENRNDGANFEMTFDCKPQRFLKVGETPETVEADVQTETGEIVTFETVAESTITSASVTLSPIQSGSGAPSPTNIRPISGHTGAELYRTGKAQFYCGTSGMISPSDGYTVTANPYWGYSEIFVPVSNVYLTVSATRRLRLTLYLYDADKNFKNTFQPLNNNTTYVMTLANDIAYIRFGLNVNGTEEAFSSDLFDKYKIMLNWGTVASAYEPYQGDTYSVTFPETIYSGSHDFVSGEAVSTMASIDLGTLNYTYMSLGNGRNAFVAEINGIKPHASNDDVLPAISSMYSAVSYNTTWRNGNMSYTRSATGTDNKREVTFINNAYTDAASFKTAMAGQTLVYELENPLEYTLSAQQLTTLQGQNVVWGAGPITLTYAEPYNVENPTLFDARPLFTVTNPAEDDVIMVNGQAITFVDGYTGTVFIDCETMNAYSGAANLNGIIQATDFPVLVPGTNIVTWTGAGGCTMTPRWWEL